MYMIYTRLNEKGWTGISAGSDADMNDTVYNYLTDRGIPAGEAIEAACWCEEALPGSRFEGVGFAVICCITENDVELYIEEG